MNIYDLPVVTDETMEDKTIARIHENKIVCHPDLLKKVKEGMKIMRASAEGFEKDVLKLTKKLEEENEQKKDIATDPPTNAAGY
jgi:regulatory protein YycI of two-component signal transduction system YycFG